MWRSRTFWRLFGTHGVLGLASIAVLGMVIVSRIEQVFEQQGEDSLRARATFLAQVVRGQPAKSAVELQQRIETLDQETGTRITLIDAGGTVLADSQRDPRQNELDNHGSRPEIQEARMHGLGIVKHRHSSTVHQEMMYVALRTDDPQGAVAFVRVALPLGIIEERMAGLLRLVWTAAVLTGLAALVLAFWLAHRQTRPLRELTQAAEKIAAGAYGHKVYTTGHDELGTLAQTFNNMSARLAVQIAQLQEDGQQLRTILSGMVEGVIALDGQQRVLFANERAAQLLGFHTPSAVGRRLWEVVRQRGLQEAVQRSLEGSSPCREELNWGGPAVKRLTLHAARLPGSPARGAVLVLHDTTELYRLERVRQEFVANVSHELKTPLSVIKACIETLIDGAVEDSKHRGRFLEQIADQADRLHALILDLISLARIESGEEMYETQAVDLEEVVTACLDHHRARAESKNQRLEVVPPAEEGPGAWGQTSGQVPSVTPLCCITGQIAAWADEEAVNQILDNLVDNALKYTPAGGAIRVRWWAEAEQACLEVEDTGIGIPEQDLPRIFERFYRVDKARSRQMGGTGLGLSIVKHLVQAMHGSIHATSKLGQGTTFQVRLPRAPSA
jgi:two-component system phosphate regulon sensor histidine kinase PhoR